MKWFHDWLRKRNHIHVWKRVPDIRKDPDRYMYIPIQCIRCGAIEMTWKDAWKDEQ